MCLIYILLVMKIYRWFMLWIYYSFPVIISIAYRVKLTALILYLCLFNWRFLFSLYFRSRLWQNIAKSFSFESIFLFNYLSFIYELILLFNIKKKIYIYMKEKNFLNFITPHETYFNIFISNMYIYPLIFLRIILLLDANY